MPVDLEIFDFARVTPVARFQEKPPLFKSPPQFSRGKWGVRAFARDIGAVGLALNARPSLGSMRPACAEKRPPPRGMVAAVGTGWEEPRR
jgi:hypothetical protein